MAFLIDCTVRNAEVRRIENGTSKKGNPFRSIRFESSDGRTFEVSCTNSALFGAVDTLAKTDVVDLDLRAVAGRERSYLSLLDVRPAVGA